MIVLDTNVLSEVMRPLPDHRVVTWLRPHALAELAITAVTLAEISYGLHRLPHGRRRNDLETRFRALLAQGFKDRILAFDAVAADLYGDIVATRHAAGRPIDAFDAMIAAIARSRAAAVATRNVATSSTAGWSCSIPGTASRAS